MNDGTQSQAQEQDKKQDKYDWIAGYRFQPWQSGNPGGRKKGSKSLKVFVREYLENLPDEEKIKYLQTVDPNLVWRMWEGNPHSTNDVVVREPPKPIADVKRKWV